MNTKKKTSKKVNDAVQSMINGLSDVLANHLHILKFPLTFEYNR